MGLSETQQKIIEVGKREFLAKGFKSASLRAIVREAGFTQGAFYGYYQSKADLFDAIVSPAADGLLDQFRKAQEAHFDLIPKGEAASSRQLSTEYLDAFLDFVYDNFDVFKLVLCCSEGTRYETYVHDLVELDVERTQRFYEELRQAGRLEGEVSIELHHMITSAYFTAVFETVVHDMGRDKAKRYVAELAQFFNSGWEGLLRFS